MDDRIAGIYKITNTVNGKVYIGQSVNIYARWKVHKTGYVHEKSCRRLHSAMKSYGIDKFSFEIIEITSNDKNILNSLEKKYIKKYHTFIDDPKCQGYNLTDGGGSFRPSKESIKKGRETRKSLYQSGDIVPWNKGLKLSDEQKKNYLSAVLARWESLLEHDWNLIKDYDKTVFGWTGKAAKETAVRQNRIRDICKIKGVSFQTKGTYLNRDGEEDKRLILLLPVDKSYAGWIQEAAHKTGLTVKQITYISEKQGWPYKRKDFDISALGLPLKGKAKNDLIARLNTIIPNCGWLDKLTKDTGLSKQQIYDFCDANNIHVETRKYFEERRTAIKQAIQPYDKTQWGWVAKAARETGYSCSAISETCKKLGIPYRTTRSSNKRKRLPDDSS
jgi:group I intron endonuclease